MDKEKKQNLSNSNISEQSVMERQQIKFDLELPEAPDKETIKQLLLTLPQQISFVDGQLIHYKKELGDAKVTLKAKKNALENEKSRVRKQELIKFQAKQDEFMTKSQDLMRDVMNSADSSASLKKAYLDNMTKVMKPEKPSQKELDDIANLETIALQNEIDELEQKINDFAIELEILQTQRDFYDNMWITIRGYSKIVVAEMQRLGEH